MMHHDLLLNKILCCSAAATLGGYLLPPLPCIALCTILVLIDTLTAIRLSRRISKSSNPKALQGVISSRKLGKTVVTMGRIMLSLVVAKLADAALNLDADFSAVRAVTAAVCLWQIFSILENEASCSDSKWAKIAKKWLADKISRHTGIDPEK